MAAGQGPDALDDTDLVDESGTGDVPAQLASPGRPTPGREPAERRRPLSGWCRTNWGAVPAAGVGDAVASARGRSTPARRSGSGRRDCVRRDIGLHVCSSCRPPPSGRLEPQPTGVHGVVEGQGADEAPPPGPRQARCPRGVGLVPLCDRLGEYADPEKGELTGRTRIAGEGVRGCAKSHSTVDRTCSPPSLAAFHQHSARRRPSPGDRGRRTPAPCRRPLGCSPGSAQLKCPAPRNGGCESPEPTDGFHVPWFLTCDSGGLDPSSLTTLSTAQSSRGRLPQAKHGLTGRTHPAVTPGRGGSRRGRCGRGVRRRGSIRSRGLRGGWSRSAKRAARAGAGRPVAG